MAGLRFRSLSALLGGAAHAAPPEDDEDETVVAPPAPVTGAKIDAAKLDAAVGAEVDKAVAAANTRWNTVMTSDAGVANPKAAARALNTSNMAADDIVAMLGDMAPAAATTPAAPAKTAAELQRDQAAAARGGPANDEKEADPDTGASAGSPSSRRGEGDDATAMKAKRKEMAEKRNKSALAKGGRQVNAA